MNKKIIVPTLTLALIGGLGIFGANRTYAQNNANLSPMIEKLAEKFNLNKDEVTNFVQEQRQVFQQEHNTQLEEKINSYVADGKLTEEQKNALLEKLSERQNNRPNTYGMLREEKQKAMEQYRTEFENWAKDNGIDLSILDLGKFGFGHERIKGFRGSMPNDNN